MSANTMRDACSNCARFLPSANREIPNRTSPQTIGQVTTAAPGGKERIHDAPSSGVPIKSLTAFVSSK